MIAALWAQKFDHLAIFPNFVLLPLAFLGGVFYSIDLLPEPWNTVSRLNPLLYMVNGLRFGFLGVADVPPTMSAAVVLVSFVALLLVAMVGTLVTVARDARVQVEFDPAVVHEWRLLGDRRREALVDHVVHMLQIDRELLVVQQRRERPLRIDVGR